VPSVRKKSILLSKPIDVIPTEDVNSRSTLASPTPLAQTSSCRACWVANGHPRYWADRCSVTSSSTLFLDVIVIRCYWLHVEWEDYWLKAKESLEITDMAWHGKKYNVCASRAYYAVLLASISALLKLTSFRATNNEWQHGQVQAELNRQLIMRRKVLPPELGRIPMDLMELRHLADYKTQSVTAREAKRAYNRAERFLKEIERALG
jgi:uncharacterized protein (UPF0332 family)